MTFSIVLPAQQTTRPGSGLAERIKQLDRNGDGKISAEEYPGPQFKQLDKDGDGFVTMEEARAFYAGRRAAPSAPVGRQAASPAAGKLTAADAVFELCVRDVKSCAKFYRDGLGMCEVEPANTDSALLEWAGSYLKLRKVPGASPPVPAGSPMRQMLAVNGFRWFSLWFTNPAEASERLVKAGYAAPVKGGNVSMTRDPEGNVVELMGVPRGASGETFTWGMAVSDETRARAFYAETLGLAEFDPWDLPPPFKMKMYLFAAGAGRLKMSAPAGERSREADAGPDAPGLRSVTLRVADLAAARDGLAKRGAQIASGNRELVTDPDGNRIYIEQAPPDAIRAAAARQSAGRQPTDPLARFRSVTPRAHTEAVSGQNPGEPPLKKMPDTDAGRDAEGRGQLFESIIVPGFTSLQEGMNGFALADLNRDGRIDIVAANEPPRTLATARAGSRLRVWINDGNFQFHEHPIRISGPAATISNPSPQVPVLADFNRDGFIDMLITRHSPMASGQVRPGATAVGNTLLLSRGAWDVFEDVSQKMNVRNELAYNRQASLGDVNKDGWLDIAIGCDNIGDAMGGLPHSRLYVYQLGENSFRDIGGTELVPDFGGFYHDSERDKAGPDINLRDLDNDGDLDLIQSYHVDCRAPLLPYSPGEYRQGVFVWRNMLVETGKLQYEPVTDNGLAEVGKLKYNLEKQYYEPVLTGPGLPYLSFADVDNDGLLDVLAVGPSDRSWSPRAEDVGGRFWKNLGDFRFERATEAAGFSALNWTYRQWYEFFDCPILPFHQNWKPQTPGTLAQPGLPPVNPIDNRPYYADSIFGDYNNDGWMDVVVLDRRESTNIESRAILFLNRGDGTFEPKPTTFSGLDSNGISGEAADLNNDGLLDLVFAADPDNTGLATSLERYESRVYWNTGLHGARENHWLRLRFSGVFDAEFIGARVEVRDAETGNLLGMRVVAADHSYKSGSELEAHFGLGVRERVNLTVVLLNGRRISFPGVEADRYVDLNLINGTSRSL
jgi:catechol 2,3-dioxygenase-like lactoylglutathione lyase family enzyme